MTAEPQAALADGSAVCPRLYFWKVIQRAAPRVVVTLSDDVFDYVKMFATWDGSIYRLNTPTAPVVIAIPHPNSPNRLSHSELREVGHACRDVLLDKLPTTWDFRIPKQRLRLPLHNQLERVFEWLDRYGWQVVHEPRRPRLARGGRQQGDYLSAF